MSRGNAVYQSYKIPPYVCNTLVTTIFVSDCLKVSTGQTSKHIWSADYWPVPTCGCYEVCPLPWRAEEGRLAVPRPESTSRLVPHPIPESSWLQRSPSCFSWSAAGGSGSRCSISPSEWWERLSHLWRMGRSVCWEGLGGLGGLTGCSGEEEEGASRPLPGGGGGLVGFGLAGHAGVGHQGLDGAGEARGGY